jgi:pSer/pThr/pTyr-binding forkhead associated (FHA) protein
MAPGSAGPADLSTTRDSAMRVAEILVKKGAKADAIEVLTVWASAKNDADGHKLLAEALRHGSDSPLAKAAFEQMEGIGDGALLAPFRAKWSLETLARFEAEAKKPSVGWAAEVGYNNNVKYRGMVFHIQTEDSGVKRPHIITHLFADGGRIIKSVKRSYASLIGSAGLSTQVRELMKGQHKEMYIALREGRLDDVIDGKVPGSMETLETPPNTEARKKPAQPSHPGADSVPPPAKVPSIAPPANAAAAPQASPAAAVPRPAAVKQVLARLHAIRAMSDGPLPHELTSESTIVGRGAEIDIVGDPFVGPQHAKIRVKHGRLEVEDLGSVNGTFLRIRRPVELDFGDVFIAGDELFRLEPTPPPNDGPDASPTYFYSSPKWATTFRLQQVWEGGGAGACHVARSSSVQIGRTASDINVPNDFWLSDAHCVVEDQDGFHMLTDLGSRGGTFTKVKQATRLITGDELLFGRTRLRVEMLAKPAPL